MFNKLFLVRTVRRKARIRPQSHRSLALRPISRKRVVGRDAASLANGSLLELISIYSIICNLQKTYSLRPVQHANIEVP